jgi:hypothetical protein
MASSPDVNRDLERLHDCYIFEVNSALEEGREDIASRLADEYVARALELLAA